MNAMPIPPSTHTAATIRDNWLQVCADVATACQAAGRSDSEVTVLGVSKYVDPPFAMQLVEAGCQQLGENRPQHLWAAHQAMVQAASSNPALAQVKWHMIGHLQRNKITRSLPMLDCLHSLDSLRLASALSAAVVAGRQLPGQELSVLLEVNVTSDQAKTGVVPAEAAKTLEHVLELPGLRVDGLMAMTTLAASQAQTQREFASVRELRDTLQKQFGSSAHLHQLSMGMSGDYPLAIAEGATLVRVGSRLWQGIL